MDEVASSEPIQVGLPTIRCACGFVASGYDAVQNSRDFRNHMDVCPSQPAKPARTFWEALWDNVFSFEGMIVVLIVGTVLTAIFGR